MHTGKYATLHDVVELYNKGGEPRGSFTGEVESVSSGVSELPQLPYSGLPVVKRELDWVRLAQDFPVRIRFTESVPPDLLRVGATATATIFTRPREETR